MKQDQALELFVDVEENSGDIGEIHLRVVGGDSSLAAYFGAPKALGHRLTEWGFEGLGWDLGRQKSLVAYLSGIQVDPSVRRRGVGSSIIFRLLAILRERQVRRLFLHAQGTPETPLEALEAFYGRLGFEARDCGHPDVYPVYKIDVLNA